MSFSEGNSGYNCGNAFHHQFGHFRALNDVTVAVKNRTSQVFLDFLWIEGPLAIGTSEKKIGVDLGCRYQVLTSEGHFTTILTI